MPQPLGPMPNGVRFSLEKEREGTRPAALLHAGNMFANRRCRSPPAVAQEALERGTTVYLVNRRIEMLP